MAIAVRFTAEFLFLLLSVGSAERCATVSVRAFIRGHDPAREEIHGRKGKRMLPTARDCRAVGTCMRKCARHYDSPGPAQPASENASNTALFEGVAMTLLSVNVNKIAVLRNSRGGDEPSVRAAAETAIAAGCGGITAHPRPDLRHIRPDDVAILAELTRGRVEYNLEGNPFAAARPGYPGFLALVAAARPQQATLVPDNDGQLTSDHGFDLRRDGDRLRPLIAELKVLGVRVSLFMDPGVEDIERAADIGADRIEIYTGPYARDFAAGSADAELRRCAQTAAQARAAGLGVNAGHDLSQANLGTFLRAVPGVDEVSIGHALIGEALRDGLTATVRAYLGIIASAR